MIKKIISSIVYSFIFISSANAVDMSDILMPVNPLDNNSQTEINNFSRKATLTKNDLHNQYAIALNRYIQSNVRASYDDFKIMIENAIPMDYFYMGLSESMAELGFFDLSELALSKIEDQEIAFLLNEDIKHFYFPSKALSKNDELYLAEMYSNIVYNDQSREVVDELTKAAKLLEKYDWANYLAALGSYKSNNIMDAEKYINVAISQNPKNISYKQLKAEIVSQMQNPKKALKYVNEIKAQQMLTTQFINKVNSIDKYISYKVATNEFEKKYYLAYYFYLEGELNKSIRTLQTAFNTKKNNNKNIYALLSRVYYDSKEYEKAEDNAMKSYKLDKSNAIALIVLGDCAYRNKDYKTALKYYSSVSNLANEKLAQTYRQLGDFSKAHDIYSKILRTRSDSYLAYYNMALMDKSRELNYLKKSISINYGFKDGWIDLARYAIEHNDIPMASEYLSIAKYIDENDFRYYYYLGLVYKNKGLTADAKRSFHKSLMLNPDYMPAKKELSI